MRYSLQRVVKCKYLKVHISRCGKKNIMWLLKTIKEIYSDRQYKCERISVIYPLEVMINIINNNNILNNNEINNNNDNTNSESKNNS